MSSCQSIDHTECVRDCRGIVTFQAAFSLIGDEEWSSCFGATGAAVLASAKRVLRRPKQTVHPAKRRRTKATSVIQNAKRIVTPLTYRIRKESMSDKPGAVLVLVSTPRPFISCRTRAKRTISIAKATNVTSAARKETSDAIRVRIILVDNAKTRATRVIAAAIQMTLVVGRSCKVN